MVRLVVGNGCDTDLGREAFIWEPTNGMRSLKEVLTNDYGLDLMGWTLWGADDISDSGLVIVGFGSNPGGDTEAWIADLRPGCGKAMPWLMLLLDGEE